jgi:ATP-dependent helicase HrpA
VFDAFRQWFQKNYQQTIPSDAWNERDVPAHLKMHYRVIDDDKKVLSDGDDLNALRVELNDLVAMSFGSNNETHDFEKHGLTQWNFGELPEMLTITRGGKKWIAYPALIDEKTSVALELRDTLAIAQDATRAGVIRLMRIALKQILSKWEKQPAGFNQSALAFKIMIPSEVLLADVIDAACDRAFIGDDELPRNEKQFNEQLKRARTRWTAVAESAFRLLAEIAAEHQALMSRMHSAPSAYSRLISEVRVQRDALIYPKFFSQTPWKHLTQLPRYLRAMDRRIAKYPERRDRDQKHGEQLMRLWQRYVERVRADQAQGIHETELDDYRWMLEEMRVSLFAQELKTAYPVSFQRIEKQWQKIQGM